MRTCLEGEGIAVSDEPGEKLADLLVVDVEAPNGRVDERIEAYRSADRPVLGVGVGEAEVITGLEGLRERGAISRVGPVLRPQRVGASTLAAMAVPPERLEAVAELVNGYTEVNHNYEREHRFNLWFVATAPDEERLHAVLDEIEARTGCEVLDLPMVEDYHIDLGFKLQW